VQAVAQQIPCSQNPEMQSAVAVQVPPGGFFPQLVLTQKFRFLHDEIEAGISACREQCEFFLLCGGGCPSNKLAEHGTFRATATAHCELTRRVVAEVVLANLELALASAT